MAKPSHSYSSTSITNTLFGGTVLLPHTISQSNSYLTACISITADGGVTGATYGGNAMADVASVTHTDGNHVLSRIYGLYNPPVGTTNIIYSLTGIVYFVVSAVSFTGINPTTQTGTAATADASTDDISVNVTTGIDDVVVGNYGGGPTTPDTTITPGTGQIEVGSGKYDPVLDGACSYKDSTGGTTSFNYTKSRSSFCGLACIPIKGIPDPITAAKTIIQNTWTMLLGGANVLHGFYQNILTWYLKTEPTTPGAQIPVTFFVSNTQSPGLFVSDTQSPGLFVANRKEMEMRD